MADIAGNIAKVKERIAKAAIRAGRNPEDIRLIAVSKEFPASAISEAFALGITDFGENRVQEAAEKIPQVTASASPRPTWHLIGHLQTNKIKTALHLFDIIHSVDSLRLAQALSKRTTARTKILLEVNIAGETTKTGFSPEDVVEAYREIRELPGVEVIGLMTVAPETSEPEGTRPYFKQLRGIAEMLNLRELSMGMSGDFEVAIEEGATMVRVGRAIFGERK